MSDVALRTALLALYKVLKIIFSLFQIGKFAVVKAFFRVKTLFSSDIGFWGWTILASVLVFEHSNAIQVAIAENAIRPVVVSYGESLGSSILTVIGALEQVPQAHGWEYLKLLVNGVSAGAHILWYFKAVTVLGRKIQPDVSPLLVWGLTGITYFSIVFAVTGWIPDGGTLDTLANVVELFEFERLNPLIDTGGGGNVTNSTASGVGNSTLR